MIGNRDAPGGGIWRGHTGAVRVLAYNIRHGQGLDGRISTARTAEVMRSVSPDLAGLNEVWRVPRRFEQPRQLSALTGMAAAFQPTSRWGPVTQGNMVFSTGPLIETRDLRVPRGIERRGCLLVETEIEGVQLRFGTLHLSVGRTARARQIAFLAETLPIDLPLVLAGDFNAEVAELAPLRRVLNVVDDPPPTYPPSAPRKTLDHIVFSAHWDLVSLGTVRSRASDHLPLVGELRLK